MTPQEAIAKFNFGRWATGGKTVAQAAEDWEAKGFPLMTNDEIPPTKVLRGTNASLRGDFTTAEHRRGGLPRMQSPVGGLRPVLLAGPQKPRG